MEHKATAQKKLDRIYSDLKYAVSAYSKLHKEMKEDFEYVQGKQWEDSDVHELSLQGIDALTINKVKPIIKLISGIERQSKSDFVAFPEGGEDSIKAEVVTRLMKNVTKTSGVENKLSEQFKHGVISGSCYIEPYIDYSYDLINGELRFKKISALDVFPDPDTKEYDLSDARFVIKLSWGLSRDQLLTLFPDKEKVIENMVENTTLNISQMSNAGPTTQYFGYNAQKEGTDLLRDDPNDKYDLIDYYYKELQDKYFVAEPNKGILEPKESKEEAEAIAAQVPSALVIKRKIPVIVLCQVVGDQIMSESTVWSYPSWRSYPLIPFYAEWISEELGNKVHNIQGVVRTIKDLQREFNKRRTQELRHLNSSANSGFDVEEGQYSPDELAKLKKFGSSPGVVAVRRKGTPPLSRITPMPLSQGHAQLAEENAQDLKEASGVNPDLLANDSMSQSGRAILLKQRQGLVMVQEMLDNFAMTKKMVGKFILSQIKEIFTIESAMKILGDSWIAENFTVPITLVIQRGIEKIQNGEQPTELEKQTLLQYPQNSAENPVVDPMTNQLLTMVDTDNAQVTINDILNDTTIGKYDVSIGEGPFNETIKLMNFMEITDLAKQGIPIPPTVLIKLSSIPESEKKEIMMQLQQQALMQAQQAQKGPASAEQLQ